jgi:beta-ureidopropionase / N-carbamoyl-L-amino-acid hydrolase
MGRMNTPQTLAIDADRFWSTIMRSGQIGPGKAGGLRRLALTDADKAMRDLFVTWCTEAGCTITIDRVGNIFARRPGRDDHLPPVLMGSHLDTQVAGGKYDGIVGVLAGLEVLRTLDERRVATKRPLELVCWTNEEGARFTPPMVASGAFAKVFDVDWVLALRDDDGKIFGNELERIGYDGKEAVGGRSIDAYFELHIEQGPILDREAVPVGIVVGGYATRGMHVDVHGETAHAGPTPMDRRRNALVGAAMLAVAINEVGWKYHASEGKATVARMIAWPNKAGILSEYAQLTCDVRHAEREVADRMIAEVKSAMPECARRANVDMRIAGEWQFGSERFDPGCIRLIREAAEQLDVPHRDILSQAGHDAYYISRIAPTAMIFTPCRDGVSHNEAEHAELDYTVPGVNVLLHAVLARANR